MLNKYFITRKIFIIMIGILYGVVSGYNYYKNNLIYNQDIINKLKSKIKKSKIKIKDNNIIIKKKKELLAKYRYADINIKNKTQLKEFFNALCTFQEKNNIANCLNIKLSDDNKYLNMIHIDINYNGELEEKKGCLIIKYTVNKYLKLKNENIKFHSIKDNFSTCSLKFYKPMKKKGK